MTTFTPLSPEQVASDPHAAQTTLSLSLPAPDAIKAGWRLFWLGVWCFIRRRDPWLDQTWERR